MRLPVYPTIIYKRGFTLLELLIVMGVIGALASLGIMTYPSATKKARDSERISDVKQYQNALEVYATDNNGSYPSTTNYMDVVCSASLNTASCPKDPQGDSYNYVAVSGGLEYFIYTELEANDGSTNYFVVCSNGLSGNTTTDPSSATSCPLP